MNIVFTPGTRAPRDSPKFALKLEEYCKLIKGEDIGTIPFNLTTLMLSYKISVQEVWQPPNNTFLQVSQPFCYPYYGFFCFHSWDNRWFRDPEIVAAFKKDLFNLNNVLAVHTACEPSSLGFSIHAIARIGSSIEFVEYQKRWDLIRSYIQHRLGGIMKISELTRERNVAIPIGYDPEILFNPNKHTYPIEVRKYADRYRTTYTVESELRMIYTDDRFVLAEKYIQKIEQDKIALIKDHKMLYNLAYIFATYKSPAKTYFFRICSKSPFCRVLPVEDIWNRCLLNGNRRTIEDFYRICNAAGITIE